MNEVAVGGTAVALGLSLSSLYLRSRCFLWLIIVAGCVGMAANVWATISLSTAHWLQVVLHGAGYVMFMWLVLKKYSAQRKFFERAGAK